MKSHTGQKTTTFGYIIWGLSGNSCCFSFSFGEDLLPEINLQMIKMQNCKWYSRRCWEWEWREKMMIMEQTMNNDREDELQEEVWWGERESEAAPCACAPPRLVTPSKSQPWGVLLNFSTTSLHHHFPAWRCPCLSSTSTSQEGEKSAGGARGRRRRRRSPKLSGAHRIFKASDQIGRDNFKKVKVFWVDIVDCFVLNVAVLDKACVAKDLDMEK